MTTDVIIHHRSSLARAGTDALPRVIANTGETPATRFIELFVATIRNKNTRTAYAHALGQFLNWCEERNLNLQQIDSLVVAAYTEMLTQKFSAPTVKQHLAAIRMCFDWLVSGSTISQNPTWSVRGPAHVVKKGKTPVLSGTQARELLDSINIRDIVGLRDRASIAVNL